MKSFTLNRRRCLQLAAALPVTFPFAATSLYAENNAQYSKQIIDTHTHFYDPTRKEGVPWPPKNSPLHRTVMPAEFQKLTQPHGVTGTVIVEASAWLEDNQWLLDLAKENPFIKGIVGNLAVGKEGFDANLKRFTKNPLFRGIRIRGNELEKITSNPKCLDDLKRLSDADLSLDVLRPTTHLKETSWVAEKLPKLRIVLDHLPFDAPGTKEQEKQEQQTELLTQLGKQKNVYAKVSNVLHKPDGKTIPDLKYYQSELDLIWKTFGDQHIIYGSNWPVSDRQGTYAQVFNIVNEYVSSKGQEQSELYFWKNSKVAYQWLDR